MPASTPRKRAPGGGRRTLSGERRQRSNWTVTPSALALVAAAAALAGCSPSQLVEDWARTLAPKAAP